MNLLGMDSIFDLGKTVIEKIWPDPVKQSEELRKLEELKQAGNLAELDAQVKLLLGQMDINKTEAQHRSIFVAGWRPFVGWCGGFSLAYAGLLHPLLMWLWTLLKAFDVIPASVEPPPYVESGLLGTILTGMLGIGAMRSHDKRFKVQTDNLGDK